MNWILAIDRFESRTFRKSRNTQQNNDNAKSFAEWVAVFTELNHKEAGGICTKVSAGVSYFYLNFLKHLKDVKIYGLKIVSLLTISALLRMVHVL